jgi:hypothetical protein
MIRGQDWLLAIVVAPFCSVFRAEVLSMRRPGLGVVAFGFALCALRLSGCVEPPVARYVYQDGEFGVVAIPVNTSLNRSNFRAQADELMARHFPAGYEIVRAEEVNEGERTLDVGKKTELETDPSLRGWYQVIKLGKVNTSTSFEEKQKLQLRECRIIYKRKSVGDAGSHGGYSALAALNPPFYLDPNELARRQVKTDLLAQASSTGKKTGDDQVKKAADESSKPAKRSTGPVPFALGPDW